MKAGQWMPKIQQVIINDIPIPVPGQNQLLVKITSASLCSSDLLSITRPGLEAPVTLGHEAVGVIEKVHNSIRESPFKVGDAIGFLHYIGGCFECEGCQLHSLLCKDGKTQIQGFTEPGFFAEYGLVDVRNAIHLPKQWSPETASVFFCAGLSGV